jgi:RNA polymerase sigma-70 factor (ECF subfamily)
MPPAPIRLSEERLAHWDRILSGVDARAADEHTSERLGSEDLQEVQTSPQGPTTSARDIVARIGSAWPQIECDLDPFFAHLAERLTAVAASEGGFPGERLCVEDLFLAWACTTGHEQALRAFENEVRPELLAALHSLRVPAERRDDVQQELWHKLYLSGERPKLLEYSGRGKLRFWFRVTAMRLLIDERRKKSPEDRAAPEWSLAEVSSPAADPEIEYLKRLYAHEFDRAFEEAVAGLDPATRTVLRNYYCQRLTIDEIAAAYGIHRATAARRVARAREDLLSDTRRRLTERLQVPTGELDSILRLIESRLNVTLDRLLE